MSEDKKGSGRIYLRYVQPTIFQEKLRKLRKTLTSQDDFMAVQDLVFCEILAYILVCRHVENVEKR